MFTFIAHCFLGFLLRLTLIFYGALQDACAEVKFTDIDYKVFTDAARHVLCGNTPFKRHTYRYSPLIAYLLTPNILVHPAFGKIIFSSLDVLISYIIYKLLRMDGFSKDKSTMFSFFWLYNPLSVIISARGNADSISAFFVLLTLLWYKEKKFVYAGLIHGLSVHLRLYPVIFSLPLYICLKDISETKLIDLIYPSIDRIKLVISTTLSFSGLFIIFYHLYGQKFVHESLLFHLKRYDIRHNYSVFFYLQYLSFDFGMTIFHRIAIITPLVVLLICIPLYYNLNKDIAFCQMCMAFVLVMFNTVLTCQYFTWYLCFFPLCLPHLKFPIKQAVVVGLMWFLSQVSWLLPAYLLEFKFKNTFFLIWIQGLVFFCSNVLVLSALIRSYVNKTKVV